MQLFPTGIPTANDLDGAMRRDLADSLAHLFEADPALRVVPEARVADALQEIASHRVIPGLFGRYFDLVLALTARDSPTAVQLFDEILKHAARRPEPFVIRFCVEDLGEDLERHARLADAGAERPGFFAMPSNAEWERFLLLVPPTLDLIEQADPALRVEVDGLVTQVVAAVPKPEPDARVFGGVSSLMLWGAVTLNARSHGSVLALAEGLLHETAHHLLFALSRLQPLVENPIEASYPSPLRKDERPMDGVYHATFVCARLNYFYRRLLDSNLVQAEELDRARSNAARNRERFLDGLETVKRKGHLTPVGREMMTAAEDHIALTG